MVRAHAWAAVMSVLVLFPSLLCAAQIASCQAVVELPQLCGLRAQLPAKLKSEPLFAVHFQS